MTFDDQMRKLNYERALAVHQESVIRESAFLPITLEIAGIEVKQFTFRHYVLLDFIKNPLLDGGELTEQDILTFIWIVSNEYTANNKVAFDKFVSDKCKDLNYTKAVNDITDYLSDALLDLGSNKQKQEVATNRVPYYSWIACYVDIIASQYGWHIEYIMELPIAQVLQYVRIIEERLASAAGQKKDFGNRLSDKINSQILELLNNKGKEENKVLILPDDEKTI